MVALLLCTTSVIIVPTTTPSTGISATFAIKSTKNGLDANGFITLPIVSIPRNNKPNAKIVCPILFTLSDFTINEIINPIHKKITDNKENIIVKYDKNCDELELYNQLVLTREKDKKYKNTNVGPHRDDLSFYYDDMNVRTYGSQGQQRTAALSLKLAEIEIVKSIIHDTPVLLLDDVLSELDSKRQNELLNSLENVQTIITCTGLDEFIENRFKINKIFNVKEGKVFEKTI